MAKKIVFFFNTGKKLHIAKKERGWARKPNSKYLVRFLNRSEKKNYQKSLGLIYHTHIFCLIAKTNTNRVVIEHNHIAILPLVKVKLKICLKTTMPLLMPLHVVFPKSVRVTETFYIYI